MSPQGTFQYNIYITQIHVKLHEDYRKSAIGIVLTSKSRWPGRAPCQYSANHDCKPDVSTRLAELLLVLEQSSIIIDDWLKFNSIKRSSVHC